LSILPTLTPAQWRIPDLMDAAVTAGADRAVADLYRLHYRSLVRLAALLVPDLATAEDIVQAAATGISEAAVRSQVVLAFSALRAELLSAN
jgi:DNA-directed RNA polymerase specialized sigma24 family protein